MYLIFYSPDKCHQMSSFAENKAFSLAEGQPQDYVEHNKIFLSRIYPGGLRTNSSNYNPIQMWDVGAQIGEQPFCYKHKLMYVGLQWVSVHCSYISCAHYKELTLCYVCIKVRYECWCKSRPAVFTNMHHWTVVSVVVCIWRRGRDYLDYFWLGCEWD